MGKPGSSSVDAAAAARDGRLSTRQHQVLTLVCSGCRNAEIARELGLPERTIEGYVSQLFLIFDVRNRAQLVAIAVRPSC
ncbi:MAG: response regulator transcription factor, partial [Bryobacteraceae bacterium]